MISTSVNNNDNKTHQQFTRLNHLVNPLQSRCSFSDSDLSKLFPSSRKQVQVERTNLEDYLQNHGCNGRPAFGRRVGNESEDPNVTVSITNTIEEHGLSRHVKNEKQLSTLRFSVFVCIFYKAVKSHFVCPICNDFLRKPKMLPSCGHMFCSHCLEFWFSNNTLRSCPVCRKFSTLNQVPIPTCTVSAFIKKAEKLRQHFKYSREVDDIYQEHALLTVLGLPCREKNRLLLAYLNPTVHPFKSKSLEYIQRKWAFQQLTHNLRFAERQTTNRYFVTKAPAITMAQRYRQQLMDVIKMLCPFYSTLEQVGAVVKMIYTGRLSIIFRRPNVDQVCMIFIAVMLAVFTIMIFNFAIQKGMKSQIKMLLHFSILLVVNDFVHPL